MKSIYLIMKIRFQILITIFLIGMIRMKENKKD